MEDMTKLSKLHIPVKLLYIVDLMLIACAVYKCYRTLPL